MSKKGFDAPRNSIYVFGPDDVVVVGIDTNHGPEHPQYDERNSLPVAEGDIRSVLTHGNLDPIEICPPKCNIDGKPVVNDGRQRVKRARIAVNRQKEYRSKIEYGLTLEQLADEIGDVTPETLAIWLKTEIKLQATVAKLGDAQLGARAIARNAIRSDDTMLAKARRAKRHIDVEGGTVESAALAFGVTTKAIEQWLKVATSPAKIQKAVEEGKISATAALKLAQSNADPVEQDKLLEQAVAASKTTAKEIKRAATAAVERAKQQPADGDGTGDGVGVVSRKNQRKLLEYVSGQFTADKSEYLEGVRDALNVILGVKIPRKLRTALREAGVIDG